MKIFLLAALLVVCEGQSTTKHGSEPSGNTCFSNQAILEEMKILRENLFRLEKRQQSQHGRLPEITTQIYFIYSFIAPKPCMFIF